MTRIRYNQIPDARYEILPGAAGKLDQDVPLHIVEHLSIENE